MSEQFIDPNWHPLLIHYPLAFLSAGILIELCSFFWPRGLFRAAGRWMILLGALTTIPALTVGLYAFRSAVTGNSAEFHLVPWYQVVHQSNWIHGQWEFMSYHVWLNSIGVFVVIVSVLTWIASTDRWRRRLYWPVMLGLIGGMGCFTVGSWFGGEGVYRFATAVQPASDANTAQVQSGGHSTHPAPEHGVKWYIPPLELHVALAGLAVALSLGTLALTLRRLDRGAVSITPPEEIGPGDTALGTAGGGVIVPPERADRLYLAPVPIFAGRFWLLAFFAAFCTGVAGLWSTIDAFTLSRLKHNGTELGEPTHTRLLLHTIFGGGVILLPLILALVARFGRRRHALTLVFLGLIFLVIGIQLWLGIAMLFDGHQGPILGFNVPGASH